MMLIHRVFEMPNRWTFKMQCVRELLKRNMNGGLWVDPFAGQLSPAQVRNDLRHDANADFHMDALEFLQTRKSGEFDGTLYDPPYSFSQAVECYNGHGGDKLKVSVANMLYWKLCKDEQARIVKLGGKAICFGWNSMGLGVGRGFEMNEVLIITHGGSKNDTLVTVETKVRENCELFT